jgi:hypothetical protein
MLNRDYAFHDFTQIERLSKGLKILNGAILVRGFFFFSSFLLLIFFFFGNKSNNLVFCNGNEKGLWALARSFDVVLLIQQQAVLSLFLVELFFLPVFIANIIGSIKHNPRLLQMVSSTCSELSQIFVSSKLIHFGKKTNKQKNSQQLGLESRLPSKCSFSLSLL